MSRADPKPGRWILPLVVAGIIGFTYTFVNALPAAEVPTATTSTVAAAGSTTSTSSSTSTTTTTLAPEVTAFLEATDGFATSATDLVATAQQLNDDWDARAISFPDTREGLTALRTDTAALSTALSEADVPESATTSWADVLAAAEGMTTAADNMFDGLVNTEGSEKRLNSLAEYEAGEAALLQALTTAATAAG